MCTVSLSEINMLQHASCFDLLTEVCEFANVSKSDIKSKVRKQRLVDIRYTYCIIARDETNASLDVIGSLINRDHSTVCHAIRNKNVPEIKQLVSDFYAKRYKL